jgi:aspartate/glutamate racemase
VKGGLYLKTIVAVYTGQGLSGPLEALFKEEIPECRFINLIDDSIIQDVMTKGKVSKAITRRLVEYYRISEEIGADIVLNTCSSVGEVVQVGQSVIEKPIVRIDLPMAMEAVNNFERIGVIATLFSTLEPTMRLLDEQAKSLGKNVEILDGLAEGAYHALVNGIPEEHDNLIIGVAERLSSKVDCIVLAQGSMMRMEKRLAEVTGKTVLSSPRLCAKYIKTIL